MRLFMGMFGILLGLAHIPFIFTYPPFSYGFAVGGVAFTLSGASQVVAHFVTNDTPLPHPPEDKT